MNNEKEKIEINLKENAAYIVIDGRLTILSPKPHGEDTIIWKEGKVLDIIRSERHRVLSQNQPIIILK